MKIVFSSFTLILLVQLAASLTMAADKIEISVVQNEIPILRDAPVRLKQIISVSELSADERDTLGNLVIQQNGMDQEFENGELLRQIKRVIADSGHFESRDFQYTSPAKVIFSAQKNLISQNEIHYQMISEVERLCGTCRVDSVDIRLPKNLSVSWNSYDIKYSLSKIQKSNLLSVELFDKSQERVSRVFVQVDLGIEKKSLVATKFINRGDVISERNTKSEWKVWDGFSRFVEATEIAGKIASQSFPEGSLIMESQLTKERLVTFGEAVKIVYIANNFEVSSQGTSMENGGKGDMVRVKTSDQKRDLVGLVTDRGVIQIQ